MNGASAHHGRHERAFLGAQTLLRDVRLKEFTRTRAALRRLVGVDVNWVACYHESAAPGCQQARASTRFP
jgi:hypothetical protein